MSKVNKAGAIVRDPLPVNVEFEGFSDYPNMFIRHDKNIAHNVADFLMYGNRAKLCMNLSLYFQYQYSTSHPDFLGTYDFHIKDFCQLFDWKESKLQVRVPDEEDLYINRNRETVYQAFGVGKENQTENEKKNIEDIERFSHTILGDAFLRLNLQSIVYSNQAYYYDVKSEGSVLCSGTQITYLEKFEVTYTKYRGRATRLVIKYKPNEDSILNNVKSFAYTDFKLLGKLRKKSNLDFIHLYFSYILNNLKTKTKFSNIWTINRRTFAKLLGINADTEPKEINRVIRNKMKIYQTIEGIEPFKYTLPMTDFIVYIEFPNLKPASKEQKKIAIKNAFARHLEGELYDIYKKYHGSKGENGLTFRQWLQNPKLDVEQKKFSYITSQRVIYKKKMSINELTPTDLKELGVGSAFILTEK